MGTQILLRKDGIVGKPTDRVDGQLKVTGGARYSAEMPLQNVAHAVMIMSTIAKGQVRLMDTSEAVAHPGVRAVLTPFNAPRVPNNPGSHDSVGARPQDRVLSVLQDRNVFYQNQPIGLVIAESLEAAQYGASLVKVIYDEQKPRTNLADERDNIYKPKKANQDPTDSLRGTPEAAFASAPKKVSNVYVTPYEHHNPMEPHATMAVWDSTNTKLTVYDATQGVFGVRDVLAHIWNLQPEDVRCLTYFVGGGFGCKGSGWSHVVLATMAAKVIQRPVKLVLTRQQMFGPVGYRPRTEQTVILGADNNGQLSSLQHDVYTQTSTFDEFVESSAAVSRMLYACPNASTTHHLARLNLGTPTYMRAPGESSGTFALETAMDEMAYAAGVDPLDLRLTNYAETDPDKNKPFSSKSLRECYAQGAERFGWRQRNPKPSSMRTPDGLLLGMGMATATYPTLRMAASCRARILKDGTARFTAGSQDIGTGTYTVMRQIGSDAVGISFDKTLFLLGDTAMPKTPVSGGSWTAASVGSATLEAGFAVRDKAIAAAIADPQSPLHGLQPGDIGTGEGRLFSKLDPARGETYGALITRQNLPFLEVTLESKPDDDKNTYSMHAFGGVFAEVHVDPDLGIIRVTRLVGAYGVGNRLNAKTARSQLIGGIVFGIGMALLEETHVDLRNARMVNNDLAEYHLPVNADVPHIDVIFVDETDPHVNPLGIKGIGEIGITGVAAAIGNAIYHATGVRIRDLPMTLDKIVAPPVA